jgi:hypothetical protein
MRFALLLLPLMALADCPQLSPSTGSATPSPSPTLNMCDTVWDIDQGWTELVYFEAEWGSLQSLPLVPTGTTGQYRTPSPALFTYYGLAVAAHATVETFQCRGKLIIDLGNGFVLWHVLLPDETETGLFEGWYRPGKCESAGCVVPVDDFAVMELN